VKKFIFIIGFILVLGGIFTFTSHPFAKDSTPPSDIEIHRVLEEIHGKTQNYNIIRYSFNYDRIDLAIMGSQEYYDSVKNEVEEIVKNTIKSTAFEKYPIVIEKSNVDKKILEEFEENADLVREIHTITTNYLSESYPNQFKTVIVGGTAPSEFAFEISTGLGETQEAIDISEEMENEIYKLIETKLSSNKLIKEVQQSDSIRVYIFNKNGEKIN